MQCCHASLSAWLPTRLRDGESSALAPLSEYSPAVRAQILDATPTYASLSNLPFAIVGKGLPSVASLQQLGNYEMHEELVGTGPSKFYVLCAKFLFYAGRWAHPESPWGPDMCGPGCVARAGCLKIVRAGMLSRSTCMIAKFRSTAAWHYILVVHTVLTEIESRFKTQAQL